MIGCSSPSVTVLVIDDELDNLRTFQRVFRRSYRVLAASSLEEALGLLGERPADVVFVDYAMPRLNGVEVLKVLWRAYPKMSRYLLTGYGDHHDIVTHKGTGLFISVLDKPWDRATVDNAVSVAVGLQATG